MDIADWIGVWGGFLATYLAYLAYKTHKDAKARLAFYFDYYKMQNGDIVEVSLQVINVGTIDYVMKEWTIELTDGERVSRMDGRVLKPSDHMSLKTVSLFSSCKPIDMPIMLLRSITFTDAENRRSSVSRKSIKEAQACLAAQH